MSSRRTTPAEGPVDTHVSTPAAPAARTAVAEPSIDFSRALEFGDTLLISGVSRRQLDLAAEYDAAHGIEHDTGVEDDAGSDAGSGVAVDAPPPSASHHLELPGSALVVVDPDRPSLPTLLRSALFGPPLDETLARDPGLEWRLLTGARELAAQAYPESRVTARQSDRWIDHEARDAHHRALLALYQQHMRLPHQGTSENQFHPLACRLMRVLEQPWERDVLERARHQHPLSASELPAGGEEFARWYRHAAFTHPLYEHDLYAFLASEATCEQLEWFLTMETAGEAAFDDLVALAQVGTRGEVKMEMARNYWDEMGNGKTHAVHTHLFYRLIEGLGITPPDADALPWQVLGGVNVMLWACIARRNAFRALGALGAVELLAPQRCTRLVHGAVRVGIAKRTVSYYGAHAIIDIDHAEGWLAHVVAAQVNSVPDSRVQIAEGLLVRANASLDYFDYCLTRAPGR